jgi:hypothetical protein
MRAIRAALHASAAEVSWSLVPPTKKRASSRTAAVCLENKAGRDVHIRPDPGVAPHLSRRLNAESSQRSHGHAAPAQLPAARDLTARLAVAM